MDRVGVGVGGSPGDLGGHRDPLGLGGLVEQVGDARADDRPARQHRALAEPVLAELARLDAGDVGGVGHVDHDRHVGLELVCHRARAVRADLLLHRRHAGHRAGAAARLRNAPRHLERDVDAEAVVERPRCDPPAQQVQRLGGDHDRIAEAHPFERLVAVLRADVDVERLQLDRLLALLPLEQVNRLAPADAGHGPVLSQHLDALPDEDLGVPAAGRDDLQLALLGHVADEHRDLVDVADHREQRMLAAAVDARHRRAHGVDRHRGGELLGGLAPDRDGGALLPWRAGRREQPLEHLRGGAHRVTCANSTRGSSTTSPFRLFAM